MKRMIGMVLALGLVLNVAAATMEERGTADYNVVPLPRDCDAEGGGLRAESAGGDRG